jgi:pilus assembly protein CpaF
MTVDAVLLDELCRRATEVPGDVREVVHAHVPAVAPLLDEVRRAELATAAIARLAGLDVLDALLRDPDVDEVLVNRGGDVWVDRRGTLTAAPPLDPHAIAIVLERVLAPLGRRLDRSSPIVDARLPDGSRVCAVVDPVAVDGPALSIRRTRARQLPIDAFAGTDELSLLAEIVRARCNVLVVGATSSGKTSLLGALLASVDPRERIVLLEDTAELQPAVPHLVRLEARPATADGVRAISLEELVRTALRLRPDRLVVGEVRGAEVVGLVQAMNTGHDGSMSTCHANGTVDALWRLETLVMQASPAWPLVAIRAQLARSIDVIVAVARANGARRRVVEIAEVVHGSEGPCTRVLARDGRVIADLGRRRLGS